MQWHGVSLKICKLRQHHGALCTANARAICTTHSIGPWSLALLLHCVCVWVRKICTSKLCLLCALCVESFNLLDHGVAKIYCTYGWWVRYAWQHIPFNRVNERGKSKENVRECVWVRQKFATAAEDVSNNDGMEKTAHHLIKQPVYYVLNKFTIPMIIFKNLFEWWDEHERVCVCDDAPRAKEHTKPNWNATPARQEQQRQQEQKYTKRSSEHRCERANERQTFRRTKQTNGRHTLAHFLVAHTVETRAQRSAEQSKKRVAHKLHTILYILYSFLHFKQALNKTVCVKSERANDRNGTTTSTMEHERQKNRCAAHSCYTRVHRLRKRCNLWEERKRANNVCHSRTVSFKRRRKQIQLNETSKRLFTADCIDWFACVERDCFDVCAQPLPCIWIERERVEYEFHIGSRSETYGIWISFRSDFDASSRAEWSEFKFSSIRSIHREWISTVKKQSILRRQFLWLFFLLLHAFRSFSESVWRMSANYVQLTEPRDSGAEWKKRNEKNDSSEFRRRENFKWTEILNNSKTEKSWTQFLHNLCVCVCARSKRFVV